MSRREWAWVGVAVLCAAGWLARPLSYEAVASVVIGAVIGAVFSVAISWHFYRQASDDLEDIHDQTVRMLQTTSGGGWVGGIRDEQGGLTRDVAHSPKKTTDQLDTTDSVQVSIRSDEDEDPKPGG
jgi:hypothetical protein